MRALVTTPSSTKLKDIMIRNVQYVRAETDQEEEPATIQMQQTSRNVFGFCGGILRRLSHFQTAHAV